MTYQTTQTLRHGNCTIVVHRPVLTEGERDQRERQVKAVMETTMKSYIKEKTR